MWPVSSWAITDFPPNPSADSRMSLPSFPFRPAVLAVAVAAALQAGSVWAVEPFQLNDIRVEGLQRTDAGTVFAALPFRIGDTYTDDKGAAALRALFATGLFRDVRIEVEGGVVIVVVDERSVISGIDFVGLKEFDRDVLIKSLKDFGIGEGQPFDKALADRAEQVEEKVRQVDAHGRHAGRWRVLGRGAPVAFGNVGNIHPNLEDRVMNVAFNRQRIELDWEYDWILENKRAVGRDQNMELAFALVLGSRQQASDEQHPNAERVEIRRHAQEVGR